MYRQIALLGLLLERPMYGQQIREFIELHHDSLAPFIKKPTIYYQLERLAADEYLVVRNEAVEAPGSGLAHEAMALRERDVYYITPKGRDYFYQLLRTSLRTYEPGQDDIDVSCFFLHCLGSDEAATLLEERRDQLMGYQISLDEQIAHEKDLDRMHLIVNDHRRSMLKAELAWLDRTIEFLHVSAEIKNQP